MIQITRETYRKIYEASRFTELTDTQVELLLYFVPKSVFNKLNAKELGELFEALHYQEDCIKADAFLMPHI